MKYLRRFFKKKEKAELLYKKINRQEFLEYDDTHNRDDYNDSDIHRIESFFKYKIFGKNTNSCVSIVKTNRINVPDEIFFILEKYIDDWFIVHTCKLSNNEEDGFDVLDNFLCDTLDGVEQIVKK